MKLVEVENRAAWRAWLAANHDQESEVWLIYYKKKSGRTTVDYEASVREALCYGWIDSIIKKIDETKYARKFTPRKESSKWSPSNIKRVEHLIGEGLMARQGMEKVEAAKRLGTWDQPQRKPDLSFEMPVEFAEALSKNERAEKAFSALATTYQKQYLAWIQVAKRRETKEKRIKESIQMLSEGKKLGLR